MMSFKARDRRREGRAMAMEVQDEPDVLRDVFVSLGKRVNVNTNQIITVQGRLDHAALVKAARAAIREVPLLCTRLDWQRGELMHDTGLADVAAVDHLELDGECALNNPAFRALLMRFSRLNRLQWYDGPPVQLLLVTSLDGKSSGVYLCTHHAVADARSDCLLLDRVIRHYAFYSGASSCAPEPIVLPFEPLSVLMPEWNGPLARLRRHVRGGVGLLFGLACNGTGLDVSWNGSRWEQMSMASSDEMLDFHHQKVAQEVATGAKAVARSWGVTLNTLICSALVRFMADTASSRSAYRRSRVMCAVSLRRLIGESLSGSFRNYLLPVDIVADGRLPASMLVQSVQNAMDKARSPESVESIIARMELLNWLMKRAMPDRVLHRVIDAALGTNACYSNPGVIEQDFSSFGGSTHPTTGYVGFGCLVPPYDFILYTPTVNGCLSLDLVYRKRAFRSAPDELARPVLEALESLVNELGALRPVNEP